MNAIPAPFDDYRRHVLPEWIDFNGHFNAGFYAVVFDDAIMSFLAFLGLTDSHRDRHNVTTFGLEAHITYERELKLDDPIRITGQLLDHDAKRIHGIQMMYHDESGELAATSEFISMHIDRETRRSAPMAPELLARLSDVANAHSELPRPAQVGRVIGVASGRPGG
ncbi:MAG: thioesterase family protein [Gaiellaceae bacterium]